MATLEIPIFDFQGKQSSFSVEVADAILDATITAINGSVDGLSVGNLGQSVLKTSVNKDAGPGGVPANQKAQRELKWLISYHDVIILKEYTMEVPCADAALLSAGTDRMDLSAGAGLTLKTEFEATVKATDTGNAVVLDKAELIGLNL